MIRQADYVNRYRGVNLQYALVSVACVINIFSCLILAPYERFISTLILSSLIFILLIYSGRINLRPLQAWCLGFIILIAPEGIFDRDSIILYFGQNNYSIASLFICISFSGICLLTGLINVFHYGGVNRPRTVVIQPTRLTYIVVYTMYLIYIVYSVPYAYLTFSQGRAETLVLQTNRSLLDAALGTISSIAGMTLPAAVTYLILLDRRISLKRSLLRLAVLLLPLLILQFFSGVRSNLLSTVLSVSFVYFVFNPLRLKQIPWLTVLFMSFFLITEVMKNSRLGGAQSLKSVSVGISVEDLYEGTVRYFVAMVNYFHATGQRGGLEHLTLLLFWVPRAVWPDKPVQLENWFHQVVQPGYFPYFHSIAATFGATGFADFGFYGGLFVVILIQGCMIGFFELYAGKYLENVGNHIDYDVVLYASAMGLTFYSVRQFNSVPVGLVVLFFSYTIIRSTFKFNKVKP